MSENDQESGREPQDLARLRAAFADWQAEDTSSGEGDGEIDAARFFDAVHGELSPEERMAIIERIAVDPEAALVWRLAADLTPPAEESQPAEEADRSLAPVVPLFRPDRLRPDRTDVLRPDRARREVPSPRWRWAAAAAASVLVLVTVWQFQSRPTGDPVYRGGEGAVVESVLAPDAKLPRENAKLRWKEIGGATYRVQVFTKDLALLTEGEDLRMPEFVIPKDDLVDVPRGERVLWKVEAVVPGEGKRTSPTFSAVIE